MPRRPSRAPRPQTRQCRFADARGTCRAIATTGDFCGPHAQAIEREVARPATVRGLFDNLIDGLFGVRQFSREEMARMGADAARHVIGPRLPQVAPAPGQAPPAPSSPPPRRPPPEAIERHKRMLAARGLMGFTDREALTVERIHARRKKLAGFYHPDGRGDDAVRSEMMTKLNQAAELLSEIARTPPRKP